MIIYTSSPESLARQIQELRKKHNINQAELAEATGTDSTTISRYERGELKPGVKVLLRILRKLGERTPEGLFLSVTIDNDTIKEGVPPNSTSNL